MLHVGIHGDYGVNLHRSGFIKPCREGCLMAEVPAQVQNDHVTFRVGQLVQQSRGAIGTAVIDVDHGEPIGLVDHSLADRLMQCRDVGSFIERRHNDRDVPARCDDWFNGEAVNE